MIEARDRLVREEDPSTPFSNRRSGEGIWRDLGGVTTTTTTTERPFYRFNAGGSERNLFGSPLPVRNSLIRTPPPPPPTTTTTMAAIQASRGGASRLGVHNGGRGGGGGRNLNGSPSVGLQNIAPLGSIRRGGGGGRGRSRNTPLPSWYPRAPLQDITAVVNAIERRRNRLRDAGSRMLSSPTPLELNILVDDDPVAAPLEHDISLATPNPTAIIKHCPPPAAGHLSKALFTKQNTDDDTDFMTPQKKLLDAIHVVEKVVMEEFRRIQRTPTAKKAERERKVRTLMAMR